MAIDFTGVLRRQNDVAIVMDADFPGALLRDGVAIADGCRWMLCPVLSCPVLACSGASLYTVVQHLSQSYPKDLSHPQQGHILTETWPSTPRQECSRF